jgi:Carboxypeptidase regulatory-like domain
MIRTIITAITFLSFTGGLDAECVLVPPLESSSHVRISVVLGGKPLKGARVIFYRVSQHECICATDVGRGNPMVIPSSASQMTDENGIVYLPELTPGEYDIGATLNDVATVFLGLHVTGNPEVTTFPMDLTEQVQRVEKAPILFHVEAFRGTVIDPTGATLPEASIVVVKRGTQAKDLALTGKADASGHFSAQLAEGSYIAVFFVRGFRPAIVPFEVARGGANQLSVSLNVGGCP